MAREVDALRQAPRRHGLVEEPEARVEDLEALLLQHLVGEGDTVKLHCYMSGH